MQTPLKKIVAQFVDSADQSSHQFRRCLNLAVQGLENEFNLDVCGHFVTALLDVEPNKTVQLPVGYLNYSKIGIVNQSGEFVVLKRNDQLSNFHAIYYDQTNRNAGVPSINSFGDFLGLNATNGYNNLYFYNFWNQGTSFNLYGLDSGTATIGTYKVDVGANVILLNPEFAYPQILLEYLSDGYDESEDDYSIDSRAAGAMLAWVRYANAVDQPKKFPANMVTMYYKQFCNEKRKAKVRLNGFHLSEMNDIIRRGTKLTAKS
jgi:hypothetical protein